MARDSPQLIVFSYHKSGTSLFLHVMTKVADRLGLRLVNYYGLVDRLGPEPDVVLLPHSTLRQSLDWPYRAIRVIRDPRDIWVSGYLYHRRCKEGWCLNTDLDPAPPILWPKVDFSIQHWPEVWKRGYLERLGGKSYQRNLLDRGLADGLDFELGGYTGCTFRSMREWPLNGAIAMDVRLEDVMACFDVVMQRVFGHFGFTAKQSAAALEVARSEDVSRMDDTAVAERPQIHSRTISKWRRVLSASQIARFEGAHGDLIRAFGYPPAAGGLENANGLSDVGREDASGPSSDGLTPAATNLGGVRPTGSVGRHGRHGHPLDVTKTTQDAGITLSADDTPIRPAVCAEETYTFVVPSGKARVHLQSRCASAADPREAKPENARRLGVRVSRIAIRSDVGEVVIAADDPRLTAGWHEAERAGAALWRWTDGSAELPWNVVRGPAVVTVYCGTLAEYPIYDETHRC